MKKKLKRIKTVLNLEKEEKRLFAQAFAILIRTRIRMALFSFPNVLAWVRKKAPSVQKAQISNPERLAWMIESTGIAFPRILKCLPRALAGFVLLRSCGWDVTLKIGTRRRRPGLPVEAHAWLEWQGKIIIGEIPGMEKYAVFESLQGRFV